MMPRHHRNIRARMCELDNSFECSATALASRHDIGSLRCPSRAETYGIAKLSHHQLTAGEPLYSLTSRAIHTPVGTMYILCSCDLCTESWLAHAGGVVPSSCSNPQ